MTRARRRRIALALTLVGGAAGVAGCGGGQDEQETTTRAAARTTATAVMQPVRADAAEAAESSPLPEGAKRGPAAPTPSSVGEKSAAKAEEATSAEDGISPGAPSDAEIRAELQEMESVQEEAKKAALKAGPTETLALTAKGNAKVPEGAPPAVAAIIGSANAIARFPYVYGGGHGSFVDSAYDCSGSVSYALAGAGLLDAPLTSGALAKWGEPGPGRWITIYANEGHVYMTVAGARYDTSGRSGVFGSRWQPELRSNKGFTVVHPPGL
jgi:cell wall-associated NlpC family hydrolase